MFSSWAFLGEREGRGGVTGFSFAVEGGDGCEGAEEDGEVGDGDGEAEPVDHGGEGYSSWSTILRSAVLILFKAHALSSFPLVLQISKINLVLSWESLNQE